MRILHTYDQSCATRSDQAVLHVAVPFTPGNGVLTPTQSNMAVLWPQPQPGTPMTPFQPTPMHYQAVPMSPGWQMVCSRTALPDSLVFCAPVSAH